MNYIKIGIITILLSSLASDGYAQHKMNEETRSKIEARRVAYISDRLDLSIEEAERFFPIYNEYNNRIKEINKTRKDNRPRRDMTEKDAEEFLNKALIREQSLIDLKRQYTVKMASVITFRKTMHLFRAEQEFKREVLKGLKKRRRRAE